MVIVLKSKGKGVVTAADIDQTRAYARELRCYHDGCHYQPAHAVLVSRRATWLASETRGDLILEAVGPD